MTFKSDDTAKPAATKPASHDTINPPNLLAFMTKHWGVLAKPSKKKLQYAPQHAARREALSKLFPGETLVIPTGHEKVRANDTHYRFRPGTDFYYLTGNTEPDCVLVLFAAGNKHDAILYVEPNPGRSDATFYTDRVKGELWVGPRMGVPESEGFYQSKARGLDELKSDLGKEKKVRVLRGMSADIDGAVTANDDADRALATALSEMRLLKDRTEIAELQKSIDATERGFEDVIERLAIAESEREVEGVFNLRARVEGNDVGYGTIAACGSHACTLHWTNNDGRVKPGELLLLDAGVEGHTLYTADITRTLPINGKFTKEQRKVYEAVLAAQRAALREVKPGNDFMAPNRAAMRVLAGVLEEMGILESAEEALKDENQFYKRYTLHNVSHMLGLDVHDCAAARQEAYKYGKLQPGMVLTVEPGLYFQNGDLTVPKKYWGIGVRIEDDVVVTEKGCKVLSKSIPTDADEVEAWMARVWKKAGKKPRKR